MVDYEIQPTPVASGSRRAAPDRCDTRRRRRQSGTGPTSRRRLIRSLAAFALALSQAAAAAAIVYERIPTDEAMIGKARAIVFGEILSSRPVGTDGLFTDFVLRVDQTLKGRVQGTTITVRQPGGRTPDGVFSDIAGLPRFIPGDRVLLFLEPAVDVRRPVEVRRSVGVRRPADTWQPVDTWRPVDLGLGTFFETVVEGRTLLLREPTVGPGSLYEGAAGEVEAHMRPRSAGAFRRWIADRATGRTRPADYFEPTPEPDDSPVGIRQPFVVKIGTSGPCARSYYNWPEFEMPVIMTLETHTAPPRGTNGKSGGDGAEEVLYAMASWNRVPGSVALLALYNERQKTVGATGARDRVNSIRFSDPSDELTGTSVLAATRRWYTCRKPDPRIIAYTEKVGVILEADIYFQNGLKDTVWRSLAKPDATLERFLGHELGHVLGLGSSRDPRALMFAAVSRDGRGSVLGLDDQRGLRYLYGGVARLEGTVAEFSLAVHAPYRREVEYGITYGGPDDTATGASDPADGDYDNDAVTSVTFGPNDWSVTFGIPISDDREDEGVEQLTVTCTVVRSYPGGPRVRESFSFPVMIVDDDSSPVLGDIEDVSVTAGGAVNITARATDEDNDPITYTWTRKFGENAPAIPQGTALNQAGLTFTAPPTVGKYTMTVTASDGNGNSDTEDVVITVLAVAPAGTSPVLQPIADRTVRSGQTVDITAQATDADNDPITYAWTRKSGENAPAIPQGTALNQARLTFEAATAGTYTMTVTATDDDGNSDTEQVVITVRQADPVDGGDPSGDDDDDGGDPGGNNGAVGNVDGDGDPGGDDGGDGGPGGNDGGNPGGNDGGNPGGNDGGNPGGNDGGNPGGNDGGNPGGNDGGNPGGNDGGSPGGNDGGSPGGNDGGSPGGNDGGSPGGNDGGSPGGNDGGASGDGDDDGGTTDDSADDDDGDVPGGNDGGGDGSDEAVRAAFTLDAPCDDGLCHALTGVPVSFRDASRGAVTSRIWRLGDGTTSRRRSLEHAWSVPGFYMVSLTVSGQGPSSTVSQKVLVEAADPVGTCVSDAETLCLQDSRFSVTMDWWTDDDGGGKRGKGMVAREGTNYSGLFWFFSAGNWELLVKVLDGCSVNGRMWVYGASATTLGYVLTVTDTVTGAVQEYRNEPGRQADAFTDNAAFPGSCIDSATAAAVAGDSGSLPVKAPSSGPPPARHLAASTSVTTPAEDGSCMETASTMCLQGGRYEVTVEWSDLEGRSGAGRTAGPRTDDSGLFHFFSPTNWEILIKVLDGCSFNQHHWVFAASATDVGFDLRVRDTETGRVRQYTKQAGNPARALVDVSAFPQACQQP